MWGGTLRSVVSDSFQDFEESDAGRRNGRILAVNGLAACNEDRGEATGFGEDDSPWGSRRRGDPVGD